MLLPSAPSAASSWTHRGDARALDCGQGLSGWPGEAYPRRGGGSGGGAPGTPSAGPGWPCDAVLSLAPPVCPCLHVLPLLSLLPREGEQGAEPMVAAVPAGAVGKGLRRGGSSATVTSERGGQETPGTPAGKHPAPAAAGRGEHWPLWFRSGHPGAGRATARWPSQPQGLGSARSTPRLWVSSPRGQGLVGGRAARP